MRDPVLAAEKFPPTSISFGKDNARRGRLRSIAPTRPYGDEGGGGTTTTLRDGSMSIH
jgi:hypothetical protein